MSEKPFAFVHYSSDPGSSRQNSFGPYPKQNRHVFQMGRISTSPVTSISMMINGADPVTPEAATVFEPIMPSTESLAGFGIILILCVVVANVWAEQVVPVSRTKLAISKSRGEVKEYLDELRASDPSLVNATATGDLDGAGNTSDMAVSNSSEDNNSSNRSFERWLFTDWLEDNKSERKGGRQKEPALPVLKDAKWNSGDNPVLAASALLGAGILFSAIVERVSSIHIFGS